MSNIPFLVYGTLRPGFGNYDWALAGITTSERTVTLRGFRMYAAGHAGFPFVVLGEQDDSVVFDLIAVEDEAYESTMRNLDSLEGFGGEGNPHNMYNRVLVDVYMDGSQETFQAYVYLAANERMYKEENFISHGDWAIFSAEEAQRRKERDALRWQQWNSAAESARVFSDALSFEESPTAEESAALTAQQEERAAQIRAEALRRFNDRSAKRLASLSS